MARRVRAAWEVEQEEQMMSDSTVQQKSYEPWWYRANSLWGSILAIVLAAGTLGAFLWSDSAMAGLQFVVFALLWTGWGVALKSEDSRRGVAR